MVKYKNTVVRLLTKIVISCNIFGSIKAHQWQQRTSTSLYIWRSKLMNTQFLRYHQHTLSQINYRHSWIRKHRVVLQLCSTSWTNTTTMSWQHLLVSAQNFSLRKFIVIDWQMAHENKQKKHQMRWLPVKTISSTIGLKAKIVLCSQLLCAWVSSTIMQYYHKKTHFINDFVQRSQNLDTHPKLLATLLVTTQMV